MFYENLRLPVDPWVASSLLQKAIRRGEPDIVIPAANTFLHQRGKAIWRKLIIIAFEDVGLADIDLVTSVVQLATDPVRRADSGDDRKVALDLCVALAKAAKDRSTDYLWTAVALHPLWEGQRDAVASLSFDAMIKLATNAAEPYGQRAMAAWYASGLNGASAPIHGSILTELFRTLRANGFPNALAETIELAARKAREPIIMMLPALWSLWAAGPSGSSVRVGPVSIPEYVEGIPLYALDKHTRIGKQAIATFARECPAVAASLSCYVPDFRARDVAYMAAFYADGMPVTPLLDWNRSDELETLGTEADMLKAGCSSDGIAPVIEAVRSNLDHLNAIRRRLFEPTLRRARQLQQEVGL